jgi:adenosylcobinamide-phosphate synthase
LIVGRDTGQLDEPEIIRATVETVAENTADGVIAPLLYAVLGGAPLAVVYKMVNTMDSMLGYRHETYRHIGLIPARVDDVFNYLPARLTGGLLILGGLLPTRAGFAFHVRQGWQIMRRDHRNHKSPNCGYPEAAAAGLLGVQLGGDNWYFGQLVRKPTIGDRTRALKRADIARAIVMMVRAELICLAMAGVLRWQGIGTL